MHVNCVYVTWRMEVRKISLKITCVCVLVISRIRTKLSKRNAERDKEKDANYSVNRRVCTRVSEKFIFTMELLLNTGSTIPHSPFQLQGMLHGWWKEEQRVRFCSPSSTALCVWCCINIIKYFPSPPFFECVSDHSCSSPIAPFFYYKPNNETSSLQCACVCNLDGGWWERHWNICSLMLRGVQWQEVDEREEREGWIGFVILEGSLLRPNTSSSPSLIRSSLWDFTRIPFNLYSEFYEG